MLSTFRRLILGLALIAATSALLLFSDLRSRTKPTPPSPAPGAETAQPARKVRVALLQHASQAILDQGREGIMAALGVRGWHVGDNLELKTYNAEGDMAVGQNVAKEMAGGHYDLLLTISTPSLQAVANANKGTHTPHVFGLVTDPYGAGVGINRENHLDHPAHLAGYGTMQPVALAFKTAREMNPALKIVGVVWNAGETNSETQVKLARKVCAELGITLLESSIENSAGVGEAAAALVARGSEAIWVGGDVTVMTAIETVIAAAQRGHIPVFTVVPPNIKRGVLFDLGANYFEVGQIIGDLAGEILNGRSPASVAIENRMPENFTLNLKVAAEFKDTWKVTDAMVKRATAYLDANGVEHTKTPAVATNVPAVSSQTPVKAPVPGKTYRVGFAYFAPDVSLESCQRGLLDGLAEFGFVEGKNLVITRTHAQGEMVNIPPMLQNMDHTEVDVIVPFSTPVLQGALATVKTKPLVFTYVSDPIAAGAGKTFADHAANVTGIGTLPPVAATVRLIHRVLPHVKTLGTLYNNSEANSVRCISLMREGARNENLELVEVPAANSNEVVQAAQALIARHVEAIYIPSDNTAYLAFDAIIKVATTAGVPVIIDDPEFLERGALFVSGPGYYHSGKAAAPALARVLLGESPAGIPMANVSVNITKFNRAVIAKLGLAIPVALIDELEKPAISVAPVAPAKTRAAKPNPSGKKWKIAEVLYNETPPAEEMLHGMDAGWKRSALVAGRDYEIKLRSAQGDIAALNGIIDAALTDGADIIVPMSTPTLQVAVQRVKTVPIIFTLVANPMAAGAGKSYTDHLPNVTGVAVLAPFGEMLDLLEKHFPRYKRIGTLFCPAEANSVDLKNSLEALCKKRGFILTAIAANSPGELPDAALALVGREIDAVVQISDNQSSAAFTAITKAARQAKKPLLSLNSTTVPHGAAIGIGRDYFNSGEATVTVLERLIAGEKTADMPFILPPHIVLAVSPKNAAAVGMTIPPDLLKQADKVVP